MLLVSCSLVKFPKQNAFLIFFFCYAEIPHGVLCQMWHVQMHLDGAVLIDVLTRWPLGGKQHS